MATDGFDVLDELQGVEAWYDHPAGAEQEEAFLNVAADAAAFADEDDAIDPSGPATVAEAAAAANGAANTARPGSKSTYQGAFDLFVRYVLWMFNVTLDYKDHSQFTPGLMARFWERMRQGHLQHKEGTESERCFPSKKGRDACVFPRQLVRCLRARQQQPRACARHACT